MIFVFYKINTREIQKVRPGEEHGSHHRGCVDSVFDMDNCLYSSVPTYGVDPGVDMDN